MILAKNEILSESTDKDGLKRQETEASPPGPLIFPKSEKVSTTLYALPTFSLTEQNIFVLVNARILKKYL